MIPNSFSPTLCLYLFLFVLSLSLSVSHFSFSPSRSLPVCPLSLSLPVSSLAPSPPLSPSGCISICIHCIHAMPGIETKSRKRKQKRETGTKLTRKDVLLLAVKIVFFKLYFHHRTKVIKRLMTNHKRRQKQQ